MKKVITDILTAIVTSFVVGLISGGLPIYLILAEYRGENVSLKRDLEGANQEMSKMRSNIDDLQNKYTTIKTENDLLVEKYSKCTNLRGMTILASSYDSRWQEINLNTGDQLRFKLVSSSLDLKIVRITARGPILKIYGCNNAIVLEGFASPEDGDNAYVLNRNCSLYVHGSNAICLQGKMIKNYGDLEEFAIKCLDFNVDEQNASIKYRRRIIGG